jgi:phosphoribosylformylglycinamidine synthase subunit PurQ / glutaminase
MSDVNVLVLTGYGLNCDEETAYAFKLAGAAVQRIHINALIEGQATLADFHILVFGGGFSWGDDHGAGVVQAVRMKTHIGDKMIDFINDGKLVIGICNGFQTVVNLGLLPAFDGNYQDRTVALTNNDCGNFRDQWVNLSVNSDSACVFTKGLNSFELPVRHGEGKFYAPGLTIERMIAENQVALRYSLADSNPAEGSFPENPNGSLADIAGICDPSGRVFGLMPHPEAYNHWTNHPDWPLTKERLKRTGEDMPNDLTPGIRLLKNGVDYMREQISS